jgi:hypothetical protein
LKPGAIGLGFVRPSTLERVLEGFLRLVAVYCMAFGLFYWVRLIGVHEGDLWRYDLMPLHWRVAAVALAVLFPIAAGGLWMLASWGPVLWFICAAAETTMYGFFPQLFGHRPAVLATHLCVAAVYAVLRTVIYLQKRAQA